MNCPHPLARAPRLTLDSHTQFYFSPPSLRGAVTAVVTRDLRGLSLTPAQCLNHFPASPLVGLSWYQDYPIGQIQTTELGTEWQPFSAPVMLSGSQSQPLVSWSPQAGRGGIICFTLDKARAIFQLDVAQLHDRFVSAYEVLKPIWWPFLDALCATPDDQASFAVLETYLAQGWQTSPDYKQPSVRELGQQWVERLAWQAQQLGRTHGQRQIERRVKAYSGRSLKEWRSLVRTEAAFFQAREQYTAGLEPNWVQLAQAHDFADQAHFIRFCKRITGFTPTEFVQRFQEDESFWLYRLWV